MNDKFYFFIVQSFFFDLWFILPGGKSSLGPRKRVTPSHSPSVMMPRRTTWKGSKLLNSTLMGPRRSQGEPPWRCVQYSLDSSSSDWFRGKVELCLLTSK